MWQEYLNQFGKIETQKPKLLLHICCAPDLVVPLIDLKNYFKLYLYWYNPNIQPYDEYKRRYKEYIKLLKLEDGDYEIIDNEIIKQKDSFVENCEICYDNQEFFQKLYEHKDIVNYKGSFSQMIKDFSQMEEKNSPRCDICYYFRLYEPALIAKKYNISYFTTTLLISPKKSVEKLNKYGKMVSEKLGITYLTFDFRKNNGFKRAAYYTRQKGIRRQNYCGCAWSINER